MSVSDGRKKLLATLADPPIVLLWLAQEKERQAVCTPTSPSLVLAKNQETVQDAPFKVNAVGDPFVPVQEPLKPGLTVPLGVMAAL